MRVTVRLFARLREIAGAGELLLDVAAGATVADVWRELVAEFPELARTSRRFRRRSTLEYARMTPPCRMATRLRFCRRCLAGCTSE